MTDATRTDEGSQPGDLLGTPLRSGTRLDMHRLRSALPQLTRAVTYLHRCGMIHRDLKPSNVMVTREGRVVVLDFGLVTESSGRAGGPAGTPAYMAPELLSGRPATFASDWYSVGVMLYMALTNRRPFQSRSKAAEGDAAPDPRVVVPDAPEDLAQLCVDLMHPEPDQRPNGEVVWARLGMRGRNSGVRRKLQHSLVGRERQVDVLSCALHEAGTGSVAVAVSGLSGMGKSALVEEFLRLEQARDEELIVLRAACYDRESVPYKAVDGIVDTLAQRLARLPQRKLYGLVPDTLAATAAVFPVLAPFAPEASQTHPDERERRRAAFAGLRDLLVAMTEKTRLVLFVEDLQWGDLDSVTLLRSLVRPPDAPRMLLVATWRSENAAGNPIIAQWLGMTHDGVSVHPVQVGPLTETEATRLALALRGGDPDQTDPDSSRYRRAVEIARESDGNPFFVSELVTFDEEEASGSTAIHPGARYERTSLADVLEFRLTSLSASAREALELLAVAGRPVELELVRRAMDTEVDSQSLLRMLQQRSMVRVERVGDSERVATRHEQMRQAVLEAMSDARYEAAHMALARQYEADGADVETLLGHYHAAGHTAWASLLAVGAARAARKALAFDRAARLYEYAIDYGNPSPEGHRALNLSLARVLANAGQGDLAAEAYLDAADGADDEDRIRCTHRAAAQLLTVGDMERGYTLAARVLDELGLPALISGPEALSQLRWLKVKQKLRGTRFDPVDPQGLPWTQSLRVDVARDLAAALALVDPLAARVWQGRALSEALDAGDPARVAMALAGEAAHRMWRTGRVDGATDELVARARALAEESGDARAVAHCSLAEARIMLSDADWLDAAATAAQAGYELRAEGDAASLEVSTAETTRLLALLWSGWWTEARTASAHVLDDARDRGDRHLATVATFTVAMCRLLPAGRPELVEQRMRAVSAGWSPDATYLPHWWVAYAINECALYRDEPEPALARLTKMAPALETSGLLRGALVQAMFRDQRGRALLLLAAQLPAGQQRKPWLQQVRAEATALSKLGRLGRAFGVRLKAGLAGGRRRPLKASKAFEAAAVAFEEIDSRTWQLACRKRAAMLAGEVTNAEELDELLRALGVKDVVRTTDRLAPSVD